MNKIEFLSASLPYGLKNTVVKPYDYTIIGLNLGSEPFISMNRESTGDVHTNFFDKCIPIIRHLDSLTQECVQADYNNGEPFIPIVELAKMAVNGTEDFIENSIQSIYYFIDNKNFSRMEFLPFVIIQQLIRWHFWPAMPEGEEVVYISETFNPYAS
jgi:hypothetical protein